MKAIVSATIETEPQFYDVDPMSIVWHGNYPRFLELGRVSVLNEISYGYEAMKASGYAWPIIDMQMRYARPMRLHQRVAITSGIVEWENRLKIAFEIRDATTGQRIMRASAVQVAVDMQTEEMLWETPPVLREKLRPFLR
ncbi:MAG: acyl-CoA thioesterase [Caulobacterales bacterium]